MIVHSQYHKCIGVHNGVLACTDTYHSPECWKANNYNPPRKVSTMKYIIARLESWSKLYDKNGQPTAKITKETVRVGLLSDPRGVEFNAVPTPVQRGGCFFIDDVPGSVIELRYNDDRNLMMIVVDTDGTVKKVY